MSHTFKDSRKSLSAPPMDRMQRPRAVKQVEQGATARCQSCFGSIHFDGRVWSHTYSNPRHPARPV